MFYIIYKDIEGNNHEAGPYESLNIVRDDLLSGDNRIAMYSWDMWIFLQARPSEDIASDGFNIIWRD